MFMRKSSDQNGATMMETLAVLSVITILGIGILGIISNVMSKFKQSMTVGQIQELQKNITERYAVEGKYDQLGTNATLIAEKVIPASMISGDQLYHRLGGKVIISKDEVFNSDDYYNVTFFGLNKMACIDILQVNWVKRQNSDMVAISVNAETLFLLPYGNYEAMTSAEGTVVKLPVTFDKASAACTSDTANDITWVFQ